MYHGNKPEAPKTESRFRRNGLLALGIVIVSAAVLVISLRSEKTSEDGGSRAVPLSQLVQVAPPITEKAVLTIFASGNSGSEISQGSGFILTSDGLAGTNFHVLRGTSHALAKCCGGRVFEIRSIEGIDSDKDLVVFQLYENGSSVKPHDLPSVTLGSTTDLTAGQRLIVIGSPQGLENTISDGILSAVRDYEGIRYLQITAPISPGSSGGPVFDTTGKMIGVASFQFKKGQNLNFAVGVDHVRPLLEQHLNASFDSVQPLEARHPRAQQGADTSQSSKPSTVDNSPTDGQLTGGYSGIVHNVTANSSAEFGIVVNDVSGSLAGCMGVKQPLFGSGPLSGTKSGVNLSFAVTSAIGEIVFTGREAHGAINGTYTVKHDGTSNEEGTFTLRRISSQGTSKDFDPKTCPTDAEINR